MEAAGKNSGTTPPFVAAGRAPDFDHLPSWAALEEKSYGISSVVDQATRPVAGRGRASLDSNDRGGRGLAAGPWRTVVLAAAVDASFSADDGSDVSGVQAIPVVDLRTGYSPRQIKLDAAHVATLMEVVDLLPPVIVDRRTMTVIDGVHRLEAFRRVGQSHIEAQLFTGSDTEAMVIAIEANVKHGKPLSRAERRVAARALLYACPDRSDRWVGEVCGLSHTTVALIRKNSSMADIRVRTGRDGRRRPVDALAGQLAVARAVADNPDATIRQAAGTAGVAPSTVHRARTRLNGRLDLAAAPTSLATETACNSTEADERHNASQPSPGLTGAASWLARTAVTIDDLGAHLASLPLSRVYGVVDECRRRARTWAEIADTLESRARAGLSGNRKP